MATLNVESKKKRKSHPSKKKQNSTVSSPQVLDRNKDDNEDNNPIESLLTKRYKIEEIIGNGAASVVHKAIDMETNEIVAVKKIQKLSQKPEQQKIFMNAVKTELQLLQELNHPNIVNIIGSMEDKSYIYIVLEYVQNGSLLKLLQKYGSFPKELVAIQMKQILSGLSYLHKNGIIHRDIKAANILLDENGVAKLADFGVSAKLKNETEKRYSVVGTPYWMAPEVIQMSGHTEKSDIWSIGCLTIELLTGHPPYWELEQMRAIFCVVKDDIPPIPSNIKGEVRDFLLRCFVKNIDKRASAEELLNHPWIKNSKKQSSGYKKLKKTLKKLYTKKKKKRRKNDEGEVKLKEEEEKRNNNITINSNNNNNNYNSNNNTNEIDSDPIVPLIENENNEKEKIKNYNEDNFQEVDDDNEKSINEPLLPKNKKSSSDSSLYKNYNGDSGLKKKKTKKESSSCFCCF